ncbi:hypothetical protein GCM10027516_24370 [Niabella aquatica]
MSTEAGNKLSYRFADSISMFPSFPVSSDISYITGVRGTAINSVKGANLNYVNSNDFAKSTSISVAFWQKHDGVPVGDAQFLFSIPSTNGHWSNATMFLIFDHTGANATTDSAVIKFFIVDSKGENWFELVGANRMPKIYDNQWHHLAFTYDETTSTMTFYKDGQKHVDLVWSGHGALSLDATKITGFKLAGKTTDWGSSFVGGIDQFRLYNKSLSANEVKALYDARL